MADPALRDFHPTWEGIKSISSKAIKWAAYGAIAVGVMAAVPALLGGSAVSILPGIGHLFGYEAGATTLSAALPMIANGMKIGAVIGGLFGAVKGAADVNIDVADAAADAKEEYSGKLAERQRMMIMAQRRQMQQQLQAGDEQVLQAGLHGGRGTEMAQVR